VGVVLLGIVAAMALVAHSFSGDPFRPSETVLASPSWRHLMGTDQIGREVSSRLLNGAESALWVAATSVLGATAVGVVLGFVAGYVGGFVDDVLLKIAEVFQVIPAFLLALVGAALFSPSLRLVGVVLAMVFWPMTARLTRAEVRALRDREFVQAARALGAGHGRIMIRHILPALLPVVTVNASFQAGTAVLIESGLAFLGLGDRNVVSWGMMLADAQSYVGIAWWLSLFPGLLLGVTVIGMNMLGDGLNEVWDVRSSRVVAT
jgi:peptide/nickel transport system permease protein